MAKLHFDDNFELAMAVATASRASDIDDDYNELLSWLEKLAKNKGVTKDDLLSATEQIKDIDDDELLERASKYI
jgi:hypothetical protein